MKYFFLLSLIFLFNCPTQANADDNICPLYLVNFWTDFSIRNGIYSVPAFLINNGCMEGPNDIVTQYNMHQYLLGNHPDTFYYASDTYEAKYYAQNYASENIQENRDERTNKRIDESDPLKINAPINATINNPPITPKPVIEFKATHNRNELAANTTSPETDHKAHKFYPPVAINLYFFSINNNEFSYVLNAILICIILLAVFLYSRNRQQQTIQRQYKEKMCPDCGSKVKPGKTQCFVCGSYV